MVTLSGTTGARMRERQVVGFGAVALLLSMFACSVHLASTRIFQVDELQNIFTARMIATHAPEDHILSAPLFVVWPLSTIAEAQESAAEILFLSRLVFIPIFWANLCLIVLAAGIRLRTLRGLGCLVVAGAIAPLWDYGFEVRHDNVLTLLLLVSFYLARIEATKRPLALVLAGATCAVAQYIAFKAAAYWAPLILIAVINKSIKLHTATKIGLLLAGLACGAIAGATFHFIFGTWQIFAADTRSLGAGVGGFEGFSALPTLVRVPTQAPLFFAALTVTVVSLLTREGRRRLRLDDDGVLPELLWASAGLAALAVNPTPFPYNLVLTVPQAAVLVARVASRARVPSPAESGVAAAAAVAHLVTWASVTARHLDHTNERQLELAELAEALTSPTEHRVLDGAGLVLTRLPPGPRWLVHMATLPRFRDGTFPSFASQLASSATPVILINYRILSLPQQDLNFISRHYTPLADDLWVLGHTQSTETGSFRALAKGNYFIESNDASPILMDGEPVARGPLHLTSGNHEFRIAPGTSVRVYWLGPSLPGPLRVRPGDPTTLFTNWY
jgi:hypothetical protein